jgi:catechol 2,3-dioxygenase-like lactoylglutathione lyase family enzyme
MLARQRLPDVWSGALKEEFDPMQRSGNSEATTVIQPATRPVQIAYFVRDIRAAAARMHATFGAGPFFVIDRIELAQAEHRGEPCLFVHSSAYGQWGDVMMELVQQDVEGPSPFRDLYAPGEEGLHHVALFVDDVQQAIDHYAAAGMPLATRAQTHGGVEFVFVDATATLGHMIELYVGDARLRGFYDLVRTSAHGWNGEDPVRSL